MLHHNLLGASSEQNKVNLTLTLALSLLLFFIIFFYVFIMIFTGLSFLLFDTYRLEFVRIKSHVIIFKPSDKCL